MLLLRPQPPLARHAHFASARSCPFPVTACAAHTQDYHTHHSHRFDKITKIFVYIPRRVGVRTLTIGHSRSAYAKCAKCVFHQSGHSRSANAKCAKCVFHSCLSWPLLVHHWSTTTCCSVCCATALAAATTTTAAASAAGFAASIAVTASFAVSCCCSGGSMLFSSDYVTNDSCGGGDEI
jgi:hypothetical protein